MTPSAEQRIKGIAVSPGIVIGRVVIIEDDPRRVQRRDIDSSAVKAEVDRFDAALKASKDELTAVHKRAEREMGNEAAKIFLFHLGMLSDRSLVNPIRATIEKEAVGAEYAVAQAFSALMAKFRANPDPVFATKVNDIEDLARRLLKHLLAEGERPTRFGGEVMDDLPVGVIVASRDLTPSQVAGFDRTKVAGFATDLGGKTSHTAIVAKALNLPAVVGCQSLTRSVSNWTPLILDGDEGVVIIAPTHETIVEYQKRSRARSAFQAALAVGDGGPSVTADGTRVEVVGNIEFPDEAAAVVNAGGEGVGLYRTEYLYLMKQGEPTEEEQFQAYRRAVELLKGRPLVIRTLDLGADKYTQAREEVPERNPNLGCRGIRYTLRDIPMFKRQIRAILRVSALGPVKVMFPLITSLGEFRHGRLVIHDVMEDLSEEGVKFDPKIPVGMMVEVPSAAVMAEVFAAEADFLSIGTNDLVQYTLAVDRLNERIANLYTPAHPAVIRLIRSTVLGARRRGKPVSCCGESASDPDYAMLLIGLGLRTLSVSASSIPRLKRFVRSVTLQQCERVAKQALTLDSDASVAALLRDRARKTVPEAFDGRSAG